MENQEDQTICKDSEHQDQGNIEESTPALLENSLKEQESSNEKCGTPESQQKSLPATDGATVEKDAVVSGDLQNDGKTEETESPLTKIQDQMSTEVNQSPTKSKTQTPIKVVDSNVKQSTPEKIKSPTHSKDSDNEFKHFEEGNEQEKSPSKNDRTGGEQMMLQETDSLPSVTACCEKAKSTPEKSSGLILQEAPIEADQPSSKKTPTHFAPSSTEEEQNSPKERKEMTPQKTAQSSLQENEATSLSRGDQQNAPNNNKEFQAASPASVPDYSKSKQKEQELLSPVTPPSAFEQKSCLQEDAPSKEAKSSEDHPSCNSQNTEPSSPPNSSEIEKSVSSAIDSTGSLHSNNIKKDQQTLNETEKTIPMEKADDASHCDRNLNCEESIPVPKKKPVRTSLKEIDYSERDEDDKLPESPIARKRKHSGTFLKNNVNPELNSSCSGSLDQNKVHPSSSSKSHVKPRRRRGRPPKSCSMASETPGTLSSTLKDKAGKVTQKTSGKNKGYPVSFNWSQHHDKRKHRNHQHDEKKKVVVLRNPVRKRNPADVSLFIPEGWIFYASVRQIVHGAGHNMKYDLYYITPPPHRIKLRSRQELLKYMTVNNLHYDPLQFFMRSEVDMLLKKGVLKYYDSRTVTPVSIDDSIIETVVKRREVKTENVENGVKTAEIIEKAELKTERVRAFPKNWKVLKGSSVSSSVKTEKVSPVRGTKSGVSSPEAVKTKSSIAKTERLSPDIRPKASSPEVVGRKTRASKSGRLSPEVKSRVVTPEVSTRKLTLNKLGIHSLCDESSAVTTLINNSNNTSSDTTKEPRRRLRKMSAATNVGSSPQSETILEERVKISSKPPKKSPYFTSNESSSEKTKTLACLRRERKITEAPPRSPYNLIQEDLFHDPWQLLISTVFLNSTSGRLAIPLALEFLKRWPTPELARQAKIDEILDIIEPLGFGRTRAAIILRFSHEYLTKDWTLPNELYGIGEYGNDSYKIFCLKNAWKTVESDDPMLMMYLNWRRATEHLRKKFLSSTSDPACTDPDDISSTESNMESMHATGRTATPPRQPSSSPRKRRRTKRR